MISSLRMRCTILALSMVLSAGSVAAALVIPVLASPPAAPVAADAGEAVPVDVYLLREDGGEVCVFENDTLIQRTGVAVAALPQADRAALESGIIAGGAQELSRLLEDLTS